MAITVRDVIEKFKHARVLVLGDMVADEYVMGRPARISREAPILILHHTGSFVRPGGATNTACNLSSLGADTSVIGVIGDDEMGVRLRSALTDAGIDASRLLVDRDRPTSTKTRIVAKGVQEVQQQIVRIDRVDTSPAAPDLRDEMIRLVLIAIDEIDALLISDYSNGVLSPELIAAAVPRAVQRGIPVVVDSHADLFRFRGVTAATPNQPEAAATLGLALESEPELDRGGQLLLEGMAADGILITRGSEGIALYERDREPYRLPVAIGPSAQVVDPNGAGDTVAAVFTLALTAGANLRQAAFLANVAGGDVVRRLGPATLTPEELAGALQATVLLAPGD